MALYGSMSSGTASSGKIALTGHAGSQAPQSMHSSGLIKSIRSTPSSKWIQSTGQTSTHDLSMVPMHGSVITYATQISFLTVQEYRARGGSSRHRVVQPIT